MTEGESTQTGKFSIIESIRVFDGHPNDFGWDETVVFFNQSEKFNYNCPDSLVDLTSGVICMPDNYGSPREGKEAKLRVTHPANFEMWSALPRDEYIDQKTTWEANILEHAMRYLPNGDIHLGKLVGQTRLTDTFTPTTIKRFTSHINGTLYGSPTSAGTGQPI